MQGSRKPCRIAVYENDSGDVIVSRMNTGLMSRVFAGDVERVMATATNETEVIVASLND